MKDLHIKMNERQMNSDIYTELRSTLFYLWGQTGNPCGRVVKRVVSKSIYHFSAVSGVGLSPH